MKQKHILLVEDEVLLYNRLKKTLSDVGFSVSEYIPSYQKALANIQLRQPDIALLDINLQGELTGLDLGKELHDKHHIPFIYLTDLDDDLTFYNGIQTKHENFLVKNEANLKPKNLVRNIQTVIAKYDKTSKNKAVGINALVDYIENTKQHKSNVLSTIPIVYDDIGLFSISPFINDKNELEKLKPNYLWLLTKENKRFLLKQSLRDLIQSLPTNFVRVNNTSIININPTYFEGRINGSRIRVMGQNINISDTYKEQFNKRYESLYK